MLKTLKNLLSEKIVLEHQPNELRYTSERVFLKTKSCDQLKILNKKLNLLANQYNFEYVPVPLNSYTEIRLPINQLKDGLTNEEVNFLNEIFEYNKIFALENLKGDIFLCDPKVQIDPENRRLTLFLDCSRTIF